MQTSEIEKLYEERTEDLGVIRLERWPEGVVLWGGGEIRWRSWVRQPTPQDIALRLIAIVETGELRVVREACP